MEVGKSNDSTAGAAPVYKHTAGIPGGKNVLCEISSGIAWVVLNRPEKRNAMNPPLNDEMVDILNALEVDDRCGAVVLTGAGNSFSAGMDLREYFRDLDHLPYNQQIQKRRSAWHWQWRQLPAFPKPTIAMVNGWCFGGAFTPLVCCDLAIAAEDAIFGVSEVNWGIIPGGNVTRSIAAAMMYRDGMYYIMTGENFSGRKAAEMRLVNEAVPRNDLRKRTEDLAKVLMGKNPTVLRSAKMAFRHVQDMSWELADEYLMAKSGQTRLLDTENGRNQGMAQFLDEKSFRPGLGQYRRS